MDRQFVDIFILFLLSSRRRKNKLKNFNQNTCMNMHMNMYMTLRYFLLPGFAKHTNTTTDLVQIYLAYLLPVIISHSDYLIYLFVCISIFYPFSIHFVIYDSVTFILDTVVVGIAKNLLTKFVFSTYKRDHRFYRVTIYRSIVKVLPTGTVSK